MKRTIARRVILLVCIISAGLLPFPTAQSLDLNLRASAGLDATVGLDDKTRAVIEGLPKEVRDQIIGLLRDALPLIDTSVLTYMNRVNEIVDSQINHVQCAAEGIAKSVAGTAKEIFGIKPAPIAALKADEVATISSSFSANDNPEKYTITYADFLYRAAVTWCSTEISLEDTATVTTLESQIRPRWFIWYRLYGICSDASNCYDILYAQVSTKKASSDPLDVHAVNATQRLTEVVKPMIPTGSSKYDPTQYEAALGALFSINDSLEVARLARKALAIEAWGKAMSAQPHMISLFNTEVTELNGPANIIDYNKAVAEGRLANIVAEIKNINDAAKYAAQLDVAFDRQYQSLKTDLQAKLNSTYNLYANAAKVLNAAHGKGMRKPTTQYPPELPREQL